MTYRDETEGLRTRVAELETELAGAREKIARLEGESTTPKGDADGVDRLTGAPSGLHLERELPFEVTDEGYEAIAELLRTRLPGQNPRFPAVGQVSQVGRTLTYVSPMVQVRVARGDGRTSLRIDANHRAARVGVILGSFYATLLGSLLVTGVLKGLGVTPLALVVALPILLVLTVMATRRLARAHVEKRRTSLAGVLEAMADLGAKHARKRKGSRIAPAEEEGDDAQDADAEAENEVARSASR